MTCADFYKKIASFDASKSFHYVKIPSTTQGNNYREIQIEGCATSGSTSEMMLKMLACGWEESSSFVRVIYVGEDSVSLHASDDMRHANDVTDVIAGNDDAVIGTV